MAMSDIDEETRRIKAAKHATWRRANEEHRRDYQREYYAKTIEVRREKAKARYANETPEQREKRNAYHAEYIKNNREARLETMRRYRERNREKLKADNHAYIRNADGKPNAKYLHKKQRIIARRADDLEALAGRARPLVCEVCGGPPDAKGRMHYDHCHTTGLFRGWLCRPCNLALGNARDNSNILRALADYLDRLHGSFDQSTVEKPIID